MNDPVPEQWTFRNMWVFGHHLPVSWGIILCTVFLTIIGTLMVYSASSYEMGIKTGNSMSEFKTQILGVILGGAAFFVAANLDYRWLKQKKLVAILMIVSAVMLLAVWGLGCSKLDFINKLHIGIWSPYINDAHRWLYFGYKSVSISVQPSEIFKVAVVLYLAYFMDQKHEIMHRLTCNLGCLLVVGLPTVLVLIEPNLSTTCLIVFVTIAMMLVGGMRKSTLVLLLVLGLIAFYILAKYLIEDRWVRIVSFLHPFAEENMDGKSYQLVQGFYAFGNGGWFGTGLGFSKQKHLFLPFCYSDFIFAIVGEELGFLRSAGILLVFLTLTLFGFKVALQAQDRFGCYLAFGLTSVMTVQVILNVLVVTGLAPTTGIPLPFFTSGGTNIAIFLGSMGLLTSVSRRPAPQKESILPPKAKRVLAHLAAGSRR